MSLLKRLTLSAALLAAAAAVTNAVVPHPSVDQRKRDAIRDSLATADHDAPDWAVLEAGARAAAIASLAVDASPQHTVLSLVLDRTVFAKVDHPAARTVVVDLHQAVPAIGDELPLPKQGLIRDMTLSLSAVEPQFVTRMTLATTAESQVSFRRTDAGLDIILTAQPENLTADEKAAIAVDRVLAREQASLTIREQALEELHTRLTAIHQEHDRFLDQAVRDLDGVVHDCKVAQFKHRLDAAVSNASTSAAPQDRVDGLLKFVAKTKAAQHDVAASLDERCKTDSTALAELTRAAEQACERHAAASIAATAKGTLEQLCEQMATSLDEHDAMFDAIVRDCTTYATEVNTRMASLRDHALANQEEARALLRQLTADATKGDAHVAASPTGQDALDAIFGTARGLEAVDDTAPDLSHAPLAAAALAEGDVPEDAVPAPPGKRDASDVTVTPAAPATQDSKITSRMQTIFPEIAAEDDEPAPPATVAAIADENLSEAPVPTYSGDPLDQLVNIDFREMELSHVVSILAKKAQINVIAGTDISGTVTANLRNVPLRQAMETALRMNGLGMIEEDGIFRIVPYEEAVASRRATRMLYLNNAQADEVKTTLDEVLVGSPDAALMSISANPSTNVVILSGPASTVDEFEQMVRNLDVAEPTLPTATRSFRLNYSEPGDVAEIVQSVLTAEVGQVATDERSRQIIVTDIPIVIEQVAQLIEEVDLPVKQVAIEAMVVDAVLTDSAQTGVEWMAQAIRRTSRRGELIGNLSELAFDTELGIGDDAVGTLSFGILSSEVNIQATISAEVSHGNAKLLTNPQVVTIENQLAKISIAQEIPYREIRQSEAGGSQTTTSFKEVGTILEVMPRVTHEDDVIVKIDVKQSDTKGEFEGVPIEDKREAGTTLRARDGQTIFIGGLRKFDDTETVRKVPFLGDIPVANFLFRSNVNGTEINELLIFLTCHVLQEHVPDLTPYQQMKYDELGGSPLVPTTERDVMKNIAKPGNVRDPFWKWRRKK